MRRGLSVALVALMLAGCAASLRPSPEQLGAATYGDPPAPELIEKAVRSWAQQNLKDPYSAVISAPNAPVMRGYLPVCVSRDQLLCTHRRFYFGHIVTVPINAKNSYGGYVGVTPFYFVFRGNDIVVGYRARQLGVDLPVAVPNGVAQ